jgi:hypothetical protein
MDPSLDHYQCYHYFPETRTYQILGSANLFPQHCQVPSLTSTGHLQGLTDKMIVKLSASTPGKQSRVLNLVWSKPAAQDLPPSPQVLTHPLHKWMLPAKDPQCFPRHEAITPYKQRVGIAPEEQRVSAPAIQPLCRITNAPLIMAAPNPTMKQNLKRIKHTHSRVTCNNIPRSVPPITCIVSQCPIPMPLASPPRCSPCHAATPERVPQICFIPIPGGLRQHNLISQEAINILTEYVWSTLPDSFTPHKLKPQRGFNLNQVAMPMVHPSTGETISSYKKLMHYNGTSEIWQTAFGKDFGGRHKAM